MHGSVSKLGNPNDAGQASAVAVYYTRGSEAWLLEASTSMIAAMAGYYTSEEGELVQGGGASVWFGGGAAKLGLTQGSVCAAKQLRRVLQHLDPESGTKLPNNGGRRPTISALDFTLSVEKDISAIWLLADKATRREIEEMVDQATSEALTFMEREAAVVRLGKDGLAHHNASGFLAMQVDHSSARPVDGHSAPHLHRHYLIMNVAERDGKWSALDAKRLFDLQKVTAAIAGQGLRASIAARFGVAWDKDDKEVFRVAGFDASLRKLLSSRQEQILNAAIEAGLDVTNRDDWVKAQRVTREGKNACGDDPSAVEWAIAMLVEQGITFDTVMADLADAKQAKEAIIEERAWIDANCDPEPTDRQQRLVWRNDVARKLMRLHMIDTIKDRAQSDPLSIFDPIDLSDGYRRLDSAMKVSTLSREGLIHEALLTVGRKKSTWYRRDLLIALSDVIVGTGAGVGLAEAEVLAAAFLEGPEVSYLCGIADDPDNDFRVRGADDALYATTETLEKEREFHAAVEAGVGAMEGVLNQEEFAFTIAKMVEGGKTLDPEGDQYQMLEELLMGSNQISLVSGQAGAGKSAGIEALSIAIANGFIPETGVTKDGIPSLSVVGCTLTANAALNLKNKAGIEAESIAALLSQLDRGTVAVAEGGICVVDECSQASTAQLHALWSHVKAVHGRLILTGDWRQLQAVEAGGLYSTLIDMVPEAVIFLDETYRQKDIEEKVVLAVMHDSDLEGATLSGRSEKALLRQGADPKFIAHMKTGGIGAVTDWYIAKRRVTAFNTPEEAAAAVATKYFDAVRAHGSLVGAALVTAKSNAEINLLDKAIIAKLVEQGQLDLNASVDFGRRNYLIGQRLVSRKVDWSLDILNGQLGTVEGVEVAVSKWDVALSCPSPYFTKRTFGAEAAVGETVATNFNPKQVKKERRNAAAYLAKQEELLRGARLRQYDAETGAAARAERADARAAKMQAAKASLSEKQKVAGQAKRRAAELRASASAPRQWEAVRRAEDELTRREDAVARAKAQLSTITSMAARPARTAAPLKAKVLAEKEGLTTKQKALAKAEDRLGKLKASASSYGEWQAVLRAEDDLADKRIAVATFEAKLRSAQRAAMGPDAKVAALEETVAKARAWSEWAESIDPKGGPVEMKVAAIAAKQVDEMLKLRMDDGSTRFIHAEFADAYLASGYVVTTQRGQGGDATKGISYNDSGYVANSRGEDENEMITVLTERPPEEMAAQHELLIAPTIWAGGILGRDTMAAARQVAVEKLEEGKDIVRLGTVENLSVSLAASSSATAKYAAGEAAQAHLLGERAVIVTRNREQANDLNLATIDQLVQRGGKTVRPVLLDSRLWVRGMPVIVRANLDGLERGLTYYVSAVSKTSIFVEIDGKNVEVPETALHKHIDQGFAITVGRAEVLEDPVDRCVVIGSGLNTDDLAWVGQQAVPTDLLLYDCDVAAKRIRAADVRAHVMKGMARDTLVSNGKRSVTYVLDKKGKERILKGEELGIASLQTEVHLAATNLNAVRYLEPRVVAVRDIEAQMIELRKIEDEQVDNSKERETEEDREDAVAGLEGTRVKLASLQERLGLLTNTTIPNDDPAVAAELAESTARHAVDEQRLAEASRQLKRYTEVRVSLALKNPKPYHDLIEIDPELDAAEAQEKRLEALVIVEEFRAKFAISDMDTLLGPAPAFDVELEEWAAAHRALSVVSGIAETMEF